MIAAMKAIAEKAFDAGIMSILRSDTNDNQYHTDQFIKDYFGRIDI